jgi:hypothetical protein
MIKCKAIDNPIEVNDKFGKSSESPPVDNIRYQRLVGKLLYLSHTHPNICFECGKSIYPSIMSVSYGSNIPDSLLLDILTR